jgi:hypothetical protein
LNTLRANRRLVQDAPDGLSFKTPESWVEHIGVRENYENMVFDRSVKSADANQRVLAIGHPVLKLALKQAQKFDAVACQIRDNNRYILYFFIIQDRITEQQSLIKRKLIGVKIPEKDSKNIEVLNDEASLVLLNELSGKISKRHTSEVFQNLIDNSGIATAKQRIEQEILSDLEGFKYPESSLIASILVG